MSPAPRNVLFITADQWRGDCLGAFGHPCLRTPTLDALAAEGVAFRRHYSQAAPCGPGRASLYTGLYLHNHRSVNNGTPLDARHSNVALEARRAGYDPVLFGYTDVSADPRGRDPGDPDLRRYEGVLPGMTPVVLMRGDNRPWVAHLRARGYALGAETDAVFRPRRDFPGASSRGSTWAPALYTAEDSAAAFLTDQVMDYLSVREDQPWFVHLSLLSPHPPFVVPEPYHDLYDPAEVPAPVRAASPAAEGAQHPYLEFYLHHQRDDPYTYGRHPRDNLAIDDAELRQMRATYYGMMSEVDAQVGRLLAFLRSRGMYERTLVVFASDHGEQLGDHWQLSKAGYFDETFHVPLVVRDPERSADAGRGRIVEAFTENVDVMPTLLEWLGVETPMACDGESLLPFCRGETPGDWRDAAHFELDFRNHEDENGERVLGLAPEECAFAAMRGERYKYVHFTAMPALLFDLQRDPGELENRLTDSDYAAVRLEQAQRMLSWRMNHNDRVLANTLLTTYGVVQRRQPRRAGAPSEAALARLRACEAFLIDMDGTLYVGEKLVAGAGAFLAGLRRDGHRYLFLTNNSSRPGEDYRRRLERLGIAAARADVFTSGDATIEHLLGATPHRSACLLGTPALEAEFRRAGIAVDAPDPDCVVVAFDTTLTYAKLERACSMLFAGKPYYATHADRTCITERGLIPDAAALIAACEAVTGRLPEVIGKPHAPIVEAALGRLGAPVERTAIVGDQLDTDMAMARRCGACAVLVLSGETTPEHLAAQPPELCPALVASDVAEVAEWLRR